MIFENINSEWRLILNTKNDRFIDNMSFEALIDEINSSNNVLNKLLFPIQSKFFKNISCLPHGRAAAKRRYI